MLGAYAGIVQKFPSKLFYLQIEDEERVSISIASKRLKEIKMSFARTMKMMLAALFVASLGCGAAFAQSSTATGGGAEGSMSSVNGASEGGMSNGSHMMKKHHKSRMHSMKRSGSM